VVFKGYRTVLRSYFAISVMIFVIFVEIEACEINSERMALLANVLRY